MRTLTLEKLLDINRFKIKGFKPIKLPYMSNDEEFEISSGRMAGFYHIDGATVMLTTEELRPKPGSSIKYLAVVARVYADSVRDARHAKQVLAKQGYKLRSNTK